MICKNCEKEIKNNAKFCNFCGLKIETNDVKKNNFKNIILSLFDIKTKKNFIESIVLCIILIGIILPIYFFFPTISDNETYILNGFICLVITLIISIFKGNNIWYVWSIISGFLGYYLGSYIGIGTLIIIFMSKGKNEKLELGTIEKQYIYSFYKSGIILYLIGSILTVLSYVNPSEEGTYTIFYGAVIWGVIKIFQGIYYQSKPELILQKVNDYYKKNGEYPKENKSFQITPGFKKFLVYFSIVIIFIIIISLIGSL